MGMPDNPQLWINLYSPYISVSYHYFWLGKLYIFWAGISSQNDKNYHNDKDLCTFLTPLRWRNLVHFGRNPCRIWVRLGGLIRDAAGAGEWDFTLR